MAEPQDWKSQAEKAQRALSSASQRNSELLERLSGMRVGLAAMLRRSYPAHVQGVEKALGGHLSDLPDSVLLGYLEAFSLMSTTGRITTPNDLQEVARALRDSGFPMPGDATAVDMAVAIRSGFQAAKYDNERLRKNSRRGKKGSGTEAIQRDLSWAEPQSNEPASTAARPKKAPAQGKPRPDDRQTKLPFAEQPSAATQTDPETQARFEELEGALVQPTPRFMRDVVAYLQDAELASEWEKSQKGAGNWAFIPPQGKHRQRGALLVPKEKIRKPIANFDTTPWGRALAQKYKAGRLYDIAVVLSKLSESIEVSAFHRHTVELTYRDNDELKSLIVGLEPGADPWFEVEKSVAEFLQSGSIRDILVVPCPANSEEIVIDTLKSAAVSGSWQMNSPVRVQGLERWVTDSGRGAELIAAE